MFGSLVQVKGFGFAFGCVEETVDRIFEFVQRSEHAAPEAFLGKICEEALYSIDPEGRYRVKWKTKRGCFAIHSMTFGCS